MLPFHHVVKADFENVNALIIRQLHSDVGLVENIGHYLVEAGGKRLRPLLVLLSARACGYRGEAHLSLAAVIEFIHTATLLHDDVVDTSELRRGRATANARWGNAPSVLVGDFLYSRAFQMMVAMNSMEIMRILADTTNIISEGEVQQLINAGNPDTSETDYNAVIQKKTAQLFEAAAHTGAVLANADADTCMAMSRFGHHLGMAFQLVDDALDYCGNAEELGKNIGDDLAEGKPTLPLIHIINHGSSHQADLVKNAIRTADQSRMAEILDAIKATGAIDYAMARAEEHVAMARRQLHDLPVSDEKTALEQLADFAVNRSH